MIESEYETDSENKKVKDITDFIKREINNKGKISGSLNMSVYLI